MTEDEMTAALRKAATHLFRSALHADEEMRSRGNPIDREMAYETIREDSADLADEPADPQLISNMAISCMMALATDFDRIAGDWEGTHGPESR